MPHWSCSSVLCYNNHKTVPKVNRYRLPTDEDSQKAYHLFFKTTGDFNWKTGYICGAHWTSGVRQHPKELPQVILPPGHFELIETKYQRAKHKFQTAAKPTATQRRTYMKAKKKFNAAAALINSSNPTSCISRRVLKREANIIPPSSPSSVQQQHSAGQQPSSSTSTAVSSMCFTETPVDQLAEITLLKQKLAEKDEHIKNLEVQVAEKSKKINELIISNASKTKFTYDNIACDADKFHYLTGITVDQFNVLMDCVRPYINCMVYGDGKRPTEKTFTYETQYLIVMMICRHGLDFKFAAFVTNVSAATIGRIFNSWVIFLSTVFNKLDTRPHKTFLLQKMPNAFINTGHDMTDLILDATEFKFQTASNYDLSALMFSHYKNTTTGKALIGISAHGMGIIFSNVYPGSISDTDITEKTGVLNYVNEGHEVMTDKGFAIQDLCAIKGVTLNRPKQKPSDQFSQDDIQQNFNIASTRIHVERFIGRVRNWRILNNIWPMNRIDLLSSTWNMLCHTVNLVMPPIGPKEES